MFKKLDAILKKKYQGRRFMQVDSDTRNTDPELDEAMNEVLAELREYFGSGSLVLGQTDDVSAFVGYSNGKDLDLLVSVHESVVKRMNRLVRPDVARIVAANSATSESDVKDALEIASKAMNNAIAELPSEYRMKAMDAMRNYMQEKFGGKMPDDDASTKPTKARKKKAEPDEDDLLKDLLA
jgi:hypothetical protein